MNGDVFEQEADKLRKRSLDAEKIVTDWLRERGYNPVDALVAMPTTLQLLTAQPSILRYDKTSDTFVRGEQEPSA